MAALNSTTSPYRHVLGDLVVRFFTLSGTNGDTLTVPGMLNILQVVPIPTTSISCGYTVAGNVVTFVTSGAFAANVMVIGREG